MASERTVQLARRSIESQRRVYRYIAVFPENAIIYHASVDGIGPAWSCEQASDKILHDTIVKLKAIPPNAVRAFTEYKYKRLGKRITIYL